MFHRLVLCLFVLNIRISTQQFLEKYKNTEVETLTDVYTLSKHEFYDKTIKKIVMDNSSLVKIELEAFKNVKVDKIFITNNPLRTLRRRMFSNLQVDEFYLDHNNIDSIEPGTFNYVLPLYEDSLQILSLSYNSLKAVTRGMFSGTNFKKLVLNYNKIESLEFGSFENMPYLMALGLGGNKLKRIEMGVFNNFHLPMMLKLSENLISFIHPRAFENSTFLSLDLGKNMMGMISRSNFVNTDIGWFYV